MLSIERNTLNYLEKYLNELDEMLTNTKAINEEVFTNVENINWSKEDTLNMYIKIIIRLIDEGSIVNVRYQLTKLNINNSELLIFSCLLERFKCYLEKVIDIYLLDQIFYILMSNFPIDETSIATPHLTYSLEKKHYFGIDFFQLNLDESLTELNFQRNLFLVKEDYQRKLALLLGNFDYRLRRAELNTCLKKLVLNPDNNNQFTSLMFLNLNTLVPTSLYKNKKRTFNGIDDPLQLTLFKR